MSDGSEFHRSDAATRKECRPTVVRNEVGGDRVGQRREQARLDRVALDRVIHETP